MRRGFLYLVAIMDWFSRKVLAWGYRTRWMLTSASQRWKEAIAPLWQARDLQHRSRSQFTSFAFTNTLKDADIVSRWMVVAAGWTNVFIERLWRSLKYECVYLNAFETGSEARTGIGPWVGYYNADRPHSAFGGRTPDEGLCSASKRENCGVIQPDPP